MTLATLVPAQRKPEPAAAAPARASYRDLEGWRGLAALTVVAFHLWQTLDYQPYKHSAVARYLFFCIPGSVDLFFLLSAILLTTPFWKAALDGTKPVHTKTFLWRRFTRVVPLWVLVVMVCWSSRNFSVQHAQWRDLFEHLTFTQSLDSHRIFYTIGPGWSMSVEVFYYLFLAGFGRLVYVVARRLPTRAGRLAFLGGTCLGLAAVSEAWKYYAFDVRHVPLDHWAWYFGFPSKLDIFALGMGFSLLVAATDGRLLLSRGAGRLVRLVGVGSYLLLVTQATHDGRTQVYYHSVSALCLLLVLAPSMLAPSGRTVAVLSTKPLATLGMITFSVYLWHEALLLWMVHAGWLTAGHFLPSLIALEAVALGVGWLSYWAIEYPGNVLRVLYDGRGRSKDYYDELPAAPVPVV